jgi:hypothetical protein
MSNYEYRIMIANYKQLCGTVVERKETEEEKQKRNNRKPYRYDLDKAAARIKER